MDAHIENERRGVADDDAKSPPSARPSVVEERRSSPRFPCSGSARLHVEESDVPMLGHVSDVSLHGCYVEMPTTFPVHTKVTLAFESLGIPVRTAAVVAVSYPFLGMGLRFTDIEPGQQHQLEQLLHTLAGQSAAVHSESTSQETGMPDIVASADPQAFVESLVQFFKKELNLSREEFYAIAKRVRRS